MLKRILGIYAAGILLFGAQAQAEVGPPGPIGLYKVEFTASDFRSAEYETTAPTPTTPVTGSFVFRWDTAQNQATLLQANLSISGHTYSMAELYLVDLRSALYFGTILPPVPLSQNRFELTLFDPAFFQYSDGHSWIAQTLLVTPSRLDSLPVATPVPETDTFAMLLAGIGLMGAVVRRRRKA